MLSYLKQYSLRFKIFLLATCTIQINLLPVIPFFWNMLPIAGPGKMVDIKLFENKEAKTISLCPTYLSHEEAELINAIIQGQPD